jgi:hypothetical protein
MGGRIAGNPAGDGVEVMYGTLQTSWLASHFAQASLDFNVRERPVDAGIIPPPPHFVERVPMVLYVLDRTAFGQSLQTQRLVWQCSFGSLKQHTPSCLSCSNQLNHDPLADQGRCPLQARQCDVTFRVENAIDLGSACFQQDGHARFGDFFLLHGLGQLPSYGVLDGRRPHFLKHARPPSSSHPCSMPDFSYSLLKLLLSLAGQRLNHPWQ